MRGTVSLPPLARTLAGVGAGMGIGVVAALMGVAGGELLIPTIVLLYVPDIKLARAGPVRPAERSAVTYLRDRNRPPLSECTIRSCRNSTAPHA